MKYTFGFPIILFASLCLCSCESKNNPKDTPTTSSKVQKRLAVKAPTKYSADLQKLDPKFVLQKSQEVEDFYLNNIKKNGYTGSFLVAKNGQIIYEDYSGFADKKNAKSIDKDTPLHVASVGKVVTAIGVLRLVDQKKLDLDQSVEQILPGFGYPEITIRTLLNHRSGLTYYGYYQDIWDNQTPITNQDVIEVIKDKKVPLAFTPDTQFSYSNTNYVILASIVEKVTNKSFNKALTDLIFEPLAMQNSFVLEDIQDKDSVAQSYKSNFRPMHWDYMDGTYGDKNIFITPRDFLKLDTALYSDEFLSKELKQQMFQGYSFEKPGKRNYGLGFRLLEMDNKESYTYHNGWWRGNTSSYIRLNKDKVCIILFSNKYSKSTYKTISLSHYFGDYPVGNMTL